VDAFTLLLPLLLALPRCSIRLGSRRLLFRGAVRTFVGWTSVSAWWRFCSRLPTRYQYPAAVNTMVWCLRRGLGLDIPACSVANASRDATTPAVVAAIALSGSGQRIPPYEKKTHTATTPLPVVCVRTFIRRGAPACRHHGLLRVLAAFYLFCSTLCRSLALYTVALYTNTGLFAFGWFGPRFVTVPFCCSTFLHAGNHYGFGSCCTVVLNTIDYDILRLSPFRPTGRFRLLHLSDSRTCCLLLYGGQTFHTVL